MSPPNLKGAVASQGLVTNLGFSRFAVTVSESSQGRGRGHVAGTLKKVRGHPPTTAEEGDSVSDFIARKDLRKLVQPSDFRQLRCVFYFMGKTAEA